MTELSTAVLPARQGEKHLYERFYMLERVSELFEFNTGEVEQFWTCTEWGGTGRERLRGI